MSSGCYFIKWTDRKSSVHQTVHITCTNLCTIFPLRFTTKTAFSHDHFLTFKLLELLEDCLVVSIQLGSICQNIQNHKYKLNSFCINNWFWKMRQFLKFFIWLYQVVNTFYCCHDRNSKCIKTFLWILGVEHLQLTSW